MKNIYIKDTKYGFGVFSWGKLIVEMVTYEEAFQYKEMLLARA